MATYPTIRKGAVEVYYCLEPSTVRISKTRLQEYLQQKALKSTVPHDWDTLDVDSSAPRAPARAGYFFPDDAENLLQAHHYYAFGVRQWIKSVPAATLNGAARQRKKEIKADAEEKGIKLDRDDLASAVKQYKASLESELLRRAVPRLEEDVVIWDDEHKRLLVFASSGPKRDLLVLYASEALKTACEGTWSPLVRWTIEGAIKRNRPEAVHPGDLKSRFWAWLVWHAHRGPRTLALPASHGASAPITRYLHVEIGERLILKPGDGVRRFEGDEVEEELAQTISRLGEPGDLLPVHSIDLTFGDPAYRDDPIVRWTLRVGSDGNLSSVNLENDTDRDNGGDYDARALVRADAFFECHDNWCLLLQAFDAGPLSKLLLEDPQGGLWPVRTQVAGQWVPISELPVDPDAGSAASAQASLV